MIVKGGNGGGGWLRGFGSLIRRKQVDSVHYKGHAQLARKLSAIDLVGIGVGATIGAGVYILIGTVAREQAGPALVLSLFIAGIAAALSALCYAELACRCPSAGSAYHYTYICIGEGVAWLVGWSLILEYTIGASAVARGITPNLALFFGGGDNLPSFLARHTLPGLGVVVDPCASVLILLVTLLLCLGIKESSTAQSIVITVNICVMLFIIIVGGYLGFKSGWVGYELPSGYFPYGVNGMFAGSAIVFFSYIGFDSVTSTAEEVKNPQRDLPIGISTALAICCILYMLVSAVIVGLVPYYALDPDTPISSAFSSYGMDWAVYIITTGAVTALFASLLGSILPQPRVFMAMARDGLLPSFFSDIHRRTQIPLKSTIVTGVFAAVLAFFMDVSQLAGMVSVGTLLAFTTVAVSVLIIRYVPPDEVPIPASLLTSDDPLLRHSGGVVEEDRNVNPVDLVSYCENSNLLDKSEVLLGHPLIIKEVNKEEQNEKTRRKLTSWTITLLCVGILIVTGAASAEWCPRGYKRFFKRAQLEASTFLKDDCLKINCTVGVVVSSIDCSKLNTIQVPESDIGAHFGMLLENEEGSDVTFFVDGERFHAHKLVLAARSTAFETEFFNMMEEDDRDVVVTDMEPKVFKALLHFIYRDALIEDEELFMSRSSFLPSLSETFAAKLLAAAEKYGLPRLKLMCESVLCKDISIDSVAYILALADRYHATELKSICLQFSAENLVAVMQSDGFQYLKENCPLLQSELLKTVAGCEEEFSGEGKCRSVWAQFSDGGDTTNDRSVRQQTWENGVERRLFPNFPDSVNFSDGVNNNDSSPGQEA